MLLVWEPLKLMAAAEVYTGPEVWGLTEEVGWAAVGTCFCWEWHPPVASEPEKQEFDNAILCIVPGDSGENSA